MPAPQTEAPSAAEAPAVPLTTPVSSGRRTMTERLLLRGESVVARIGLGAAGLLLLTVSGLGAWTAYTQQRDTVERRTGEMRGAGELLARGCEALLIGRDTSSVRTLVSTMVVRQGLSGARITLGSPEGQVIARSSSEAGRGGLERKSLSKHARGEELVDPPEVWGATSVAQAMATGEPEVTRLGDGGVGLKIPMFVVGRGPAMLEMESGPVALSWTTSDALAGTAGISAAGLVGALLMYRSTRRRLRALGAISEALSAPGTMNGESLAISPEWGPLAQAWNTVLAERETAKQQALLERAADHVAGRGVRDGELASACDALWQGMVVVDDRARVKYANGAAAVLLRAKREELVGGDFGAFMTEEKVLEAVKSVADGRVRGRTTAEIERPAEKGGGVLRFTVRPVRKEDAGSALVVIEDVTQQRVADKARHSFVAQATHELRTPLTNIRLYVETLLDEPDQEAAKRSQALNVISQETRRLERLVGDMLNVAEIDAGSMKLNTGEVRLETVFAELEQEFGESAKQKDITLKFELPPKWPQVSGDRDKIVMAAHNLLGNALKYTPAGGEVAVRAGFENGQLSVEVADNGIGIKSEEQELVFEKFYRAKDRRIANITGTGLGLSIAREVVRMHGGDIRLESQVDKGSTFTMTLPAKAA